MKIGFYLAFSMLICGTVSRAATRPNILFIYTDDQTCRSISCYEDAYTWTETPEIDRLAREGLRFRQAYIGTWCMASRAQLLTGLHPHAIESLRMEGDYPRNVYDPQQCRFWPGTFREAGYVTGMIGKWHTGMDTGFGREWDYQAVWNHVDPGTYGGYYHGQSISFNGGPPTKVDGYSTDNYTRWALEFIQGAHRAADKPWFLWLCYDAVHSPYQEAARHEQDYQGAPPVPVPADVFPPRLDKPSYMRDYGVWRRGPGGAPTFKEQPLDYWVQKYSRAVRAIDEGVGQILSALDETGQAEDTLVVFTSDQGFAWGQHGFAWKYAPYDANLLAPLIVRWPGHAPAGAVCQHPVGGLDLVPTFFAAAGVPQPWSMHGHDLVPLLASPDAPWPHPVMLVQTKWYFGSDTRRIPQRDDARWNGVPWYVMLRSGRAKYVRTLEPGEPEELYDLLDDPQELQNLASLPAYRSQLTQLRQLALSELRRTECPFVDALPTTSVGD